MNAPRRYAPLQHEACVSENLTLRSAPQERVSKGGQLKPPQRECPVCDTHVVTAPARDVTVPIVLAVGGAVLLGTGMYFYGVAGADAMIYANQNASVAIQDAVRSQGEAFRWIGLTGLVLGVAAEVAAVVIYTRPAPRTEHAAHQTARPMARVSVGLGSIGVSGTF